MRRSILNFKLQIFRLAKGHWSLRQLTKLAIFIATHMKKHFAVHFTKGSFCQFVDRKVVGLNAKVLPACSNARDDSQVSIFFFP